MAVRTGIKGISMPKLKVTIDPDIDFGVIAWGEAFGFQAMVGFRRKKSVNQGPTTLSKEEIFDLPSDDYEEQHSELSASQK